MPSNSRRSFKNIKIIMCAQCKLKVEEDESIQCDKCEETFHAICTELDKRQYNYLVENEGEEYVCHICDESGGNVKSELTMIKTQLKKLNQLDILQESMQFMSKQFDGILKGIAADNKKKLEAVQNVNKKLKTKIKIKELKSAVRSLNDTIVQNDCIVNDLKVNENSDAVGTMTALIKDVGVELKESDVDVAYFMKSNRGFIKDFADKCDVGFIRSVEGSRDIYDPESTNLKTKSGKHRVVNWGSQLQPEQPTIADWNKIEHDKEEDSEELTNEAGIAISEILKGRHNSDKEDLSTLFDEMSTNSKEELQDSEENNTTVDGSILCKTTSCVELALNEHKWISVDVFKQFLNNLVNVAQDNGVNIETYSKNGVFGIGITSHSQPNKTSDNKPRKIPSTKPETSKPQTSKQPNTVRLQPNTIEPEPIIEKQVKSTQTTKESSEGRVNHFLRLIDNKIKLKGKYGVSDLNLTSKTKGFSKDSVLEHFRQTNIPSTLGEAVESLCRANKIWTRYDIAYTITDFNLKLID